MSKPEPKRLSAEREAELRAEIASFARPDLIIVRVTGQELRCLFDELDTLRKAASSRDDFFNSVPGMRRIDPAELAEYERAMREEAIPAMIEAERRQHQLANESRQMWLG